MFESKSEKSKPLILAPNWVRRGPRKTLDILPQIIKSVKTGDTITITDPKGSAETIRMMAQRNGWQVHIIHQVEEQYRLGYASNNWLRMHGYPLRRKMHNEERRQKDRIERRDKRKGIDHCRSMYLDETYTFFLRDRMV